jgi:hypothetical protein
MTMTRFHCHSKAPMRHPLETFVPAEERHSIYSWRVLRRPNSDQHQAPLRFSLCGTRRLTVHRRPYGGRLLPIAARGAERSEATHQARCRPAGHAHSPSRHLFRGQRQPLLHGLLLTSFRSPPAEVERSEATHRSPRGFGLPGRPLTVYRFICSRINSTALAWAA